MRFLKPIKWKLKVSSLEAKLAKVALPWVASMITSLPYSRRLSRWLDWLILISEG